MSVTQEDLRCLLIGVCDLKVEGVQQSDWSDENAGCAVVFWMGSESCAG